MNNLDLSKEEEINSVYAQLRREQMELQLKYFNKLPLATKIKILEDLVKGKYEEELFKQIYKTNQENAASINLGI